MKTWFPSGLSLFKVRLPENDVRVAVATAAALNVTGMPLELIILRNFPSAPKWPEYVSIAVSAMILASILLGKFREKTRFVGALMVVNAAVISFALHSVYASLARASEGTIAFQATKLGCLVAGMLAPGFLVGLLSVGIHAGTSVAQFLGFSAATQKAIGPAEPWATVAFGVAGVLILAHRLRVRQLEMASAQARTEAESTRRLAQVFLELRDLMNTPLQSIEIATTLLRKKKDKNYGDIIDQLHQSCERLNKINHNLKQFEHKLEWKPERGGLS